MDFKFPTCPKKNKASLVCYNRTCKSNPFICNCHWKCDCMDLHKNCQYLIWNHILNEINYKKLKNQPQFKDLIQNIDQIYQNSMKLINKSHKQFKNWVETFGLNQGEILLQKLVRQKNFGEINVRLINDIQKGIDLNYFAILKSKNIIDEQLKTAFNNIKIFTDSINNIYKTIKITSQKIKQSDNYQKSKPLTVQQLEEIQRQKKSIIDYKLNLTRGIKQHQNLELLEYLKSDTLLALDLDGNHIINVQFLNKLLFPNLQSLSLYTNDITSIQTLPKVRFPHLQKLFLNYNKISDITPLSYVVFPNLQILALQNNQIQFIESLANVNFQNLQTLWLKQNKIQNLQPLAKANFPNLQKLELQNNRIQNIHPLIKFNFPLLQTLWIHQNRVLDLYPLSKIRFSNLHALWIRINNIQFIKKSVQTNRYRALQRLDSQKGKSRMHFQIYRLILTHFYYNINIMQENLFKQQSIGPEINLKQILYREYYKTVELIYLTNNFQKDPKLYRDLKFSRYENLSIVGELLKIQKMSFQQVGQYYCPRLSLKCLNNNESRMIVLTKQQYKNNFVKVFNQMLRDKKIYLISSLKLVFINRGIYFRWTRNTQIIQISPHYYQQIYRKIQCIFKSDSFSSLDFTQFVLPAEKLHCSTYGYNFDQILKKYMQTNRIIPIISGIISIKRHGEGFDKYKKQMCMTIHQAYLNGRAKQIGIIDFVVKYHIQKQQLLKNLLKQGLHYAFINVTKRISAKCQIYYELQDHFNDIVLLQTTPTIINDSFRHHKITRSKFVDLNTSSKVYRNFMKFRIDIVSVEFINIIFKCKKCNEKLTEDKCRRCNNNGELDIWSFLIAQDQTSQAFLSLKTQNSKKLFGIDQEAEKILIQICKERGFFKKNNFKQFKIEELKALHHRIQFQLFQKYIIGIPYVQHYKTFKQKLEQKDYIQYQRGFFNQHQFLNSTSINVNGAIIKSMKLSKKTLKAIPSVKVYAIYDLSDMATDFGEY